MKLTIPTRNDPAARAGLFALLAAVAYIAFSTLGQVAPTSAQSDIILMATPQPTAALPTPAPGVPAFALAVPTPESASWVDQALGGVNVAAHQFADEQAARLSSEQAAAQAAEAQAAAEQAARDQYLANVGAQAAHSPRGDVPQPAPSFETGPIVQPPDSAGQVIVIDPNPAPVAPAPQIAVAVPHISAEQAVVIGERQSNGCAPGEVFYPRTGCHLPGSGGPQPGAVGAP